MECWTKARVKGGGRPGAVGGKRAQQNAPTTHPWHDACEKTGLQKSVHLDTFVDTIRVAGIEYLVRVRARVSWSSLSSELGWHINLCIFEVHVLHTSGGPGAGASGHCQRSASVGALHNLHSPFFLSLEVFPTLQPPREPSGGLVL
jgi:hypothetical protein